MKVTRIAVIGAGTIGSAIAKSLLSKGFEKITATRRQADRLNDLRDLGATVTSDNRRAAAEADVIVLCVKPSDALEVLEDIKEEAAGKLVISVAAALPLQLLKSRAPRSRFIRAMPNMAVLVQESFTAYCVDKDVTDEDRERAKEIFEAM
ncbi:MAG: NAD(P)-binding domain-containing protein, partial [Aigarchaeota archaeon]|nr:NAD(P)-binding domain-containing protein [Aigarchaeota archaeon]